MDSFINKLTEGTTVKNTDYTVFDVANTTTGSFSTQKISYASLTKQLSSDITDNVKTLINGLQSNLNEISTSISNKLDKKGLTLNSGEKMSGTLSVLTLCAANVAHFNNNIDVHNNYISNVKDPVLDYDAVNKRSLTQALNNLNVPSGNLFLSKTGDSMTGGNLTLFSEPTSDKHASTKKYVDDKITVLNNSINNLSNSSSNYIPLAGGTMTSGFIKAATDNPPTDPKHLTNKKYVDDTITTRTAGFATNNTVDTTYVKKAGDTMTGTLNLKGFSEITGTATGTGSVSLNLNLGNTFPIVLTGNITGFTTTNAPTNSFSITLFITQASSASYTVAWTIDGTTIKWANGVVPVMTATNNQTDVYCFTKVGTVWYGFNGGQNF